MDARARREEVAPRVPVVAGVVLAEAVDDDPRDDEGPRRPAAGRPGLVRPGERGVAPPADRLDPVTPVVGTVDAVGVRVVKLRGSRVGAPPDGLILTPAKGRVGPGPRRSVFGVSGSFGDTVGRPPDVVLQEKVGPVASPSPAPVHPGVFRST